MERLEYLTEEHRRLSEEIFRELSNKLPVTSSTFLQELKGQKYERNELLQLGAVYMKENLSNAVEVWETLARTAEGPDQKCLPETHLYATQIALGYWTQALSSAQGFYDEVRSFQKANELGNTFELKKQTIFQATINLANAQRISRSATTPEKLYEEALAFAQVTEDKHGEMLCNIYLAICLLDKGHLKQAMQLYLDPLYSHKENMVTSTKILYLHHYGSACRSAADWGRAKMFLGEALGLAKQVGDLGSISACLGELGNIYRSEGRFKDAEKCHSLHYNIALKRGDLCQLAVACGNLGFLKFYKPGELTESVGYLAMQYTFSARFGDTFRKGVACNSIGKVYTALGHYHRAIHFFESVLELARQVSNKASEGMAWGNLGTAYRFLGKYEDAIECHIKYRDNAEERLDTGGVAIMQRELALDYLLNGDLRLAELSIVGAFETLEKIREQLGEDDKAKMSNFEKNQSEAFDLLQSILVAQKKHKEAFVVADLMRARVLYENVARRSEPSRPAANKFRQVSSVLDRGFVDESFSQLLAVSRECKAAIVSYSLVREFGSGAEPKQYLYTGILFPSGRLHFKRQSLTAELTTEVKVDESFVISLCRSLSPSGDVESLLKSISRSICKVDSKKSSGSNEKSTDIEILLNSIEEEFHAPRSSSEMGKSGGAAGSGYPSAKHGKSPSHPGTEINVNNLQTASIWKEKEESIIQDSHNVATSCHEKRKNHQVSHQFDSEITSTSQAAENGWVKEKKPESLSTRRDNTQGETKEENDAQNENNPSGPLPESWKSFLFQLYEVLIGPISQHLEAEREGIEKIVFVPQGFLLRVPFAALKASEKDKFLVEKFPILTAPSVTLLNLTTRQWSNRAAGDKNEEFTLLSVGNPKMPSDKIKQLPWAGKEAGKVAEILGSSKAQLLTNEAATKEAVMAAMSQHNMIHLASHAMVDEEESHGDYSMRGFIVLARSNENCNGILTAEEVSQMNINAELVVLSCCNTALGKVTEDGVLGLSRAFLTAGAACVVVTLWKINDLVTSRLMEAFYNCYKTTRDAPLALQQAMRTIQDNGTMQKPHEWAAFTIVGCSGKIRKYL